MESNRNQQSETQTQSKTKTGRGFWKQITNKQVSFLKNFWASQSTENVSSFDFLVLRRVCLMLSVQAGLELILELRTTSKS